MSNWFEDNPTKSILGYTLVVVGATWATSTFILQDNRLNLARSETESQKTLAEQYKAKVDLLERDLDVARAENAEYRAWLEKSNNAIPVIMPRITELKKRIAELEEQTKVRGEFNSLETPSYVTVGKGTAYFDDALNVVFAVNSITVRREAAIALRVPDRKEPFEAVAKAGDQWVFKSKGKMYSLAIAEVSYLTDTVKIRVTPQQ